jgi:TM2 domain-containing membrane protein YozV
MQPQRQEVNVGIAYLLWALGFMGVCGIQRFYVGRAGSGVLWLLTGGICGFGQFIDLFLIPSMVEERNRYIWEKQRTDRLFNLVESDRLPININSDRTPQKEAVKEVVPEKSDPMLKILKAAAANNNQLSIGQAMIMTEMTHEEIENLFKQAMRQGIARVDNDPETGAVRYYFDI